MRHGHLCARIIRVANSMECTRMFAQGHSFQSRRCGWLNAANCSAHSSLYLQWSYGVCVWELLTRGQKPYAQINSKLEVYEYLRDNKRLPMPPLSPPVIYTEIMMRCWQWSHSQRPTFVHICRDLPRIISRLERDNARHLMDNEYELPNASM